MGIVLGQPLCGERGLGGVEIAAEEHLDAPVCRGGHRGDGDLRRHHPLAEMQKAVPVREQLLIRQFGEIGLVIQDAAHGLVDDF
jgi:hypothetical protein